MTESAANYKRQHRKWNMETLALLRANGANLGRHHSITNVFFVSSADQCKTLTQALVAQLLVVTKDQPAGDESDARWSVYGEILLIPNEQELGRMTDQCIRLAFTAGAEYDGWFTEPVT